MNYKELISSNLTVNLIDEINSIDLSKCSIHDLCFLKTWSENLKSVADKLTLEDEIVGYTYDNLGVLTPKITSEVAKRKIKM